MPNARQVLSSLCAQKQEAGALTYRPPHDGGDGIRNCRGSGDAVAMLMALSVWWFGTAVSPL